MSSLSITPISIDYTRFPLAELLKKKTKAADNKSQLALACKNLGDFYIQEGDYQNALREYQQEAKIHESVKSQLKYAIANRWIGEAHLGLEEFGESLKHVEMYLSEYSATTAITDVCPEASS